jgi:hypothetical protein
VPFNGDLHYYRLQHHIAQFSARFKGLKRFTVLPPWLPYSSERGYISKYVVEYVEEANKVLRSSGKMTTVYAGAQAPFQQIGQIYLGGRRGKVAQNPR